MFSKNFVLEVETLLVSIMTSVNNRVISWQYNFKYALK